MSTSRGLSNWRLALVAVLATVAAACTQGTTGTTAAGETTTTAAPPDDGETTTTVPAIESFIYKIGLTEDLTTDNYWAHLGQESSVYNSYVLGSSQPSLFTVAYPNIILVPDLGVSAPVEASQEGGVWVVEQPIRRGYMWSDGEEVTADDLAFTYNVVKDFALGERWASVFNLHADAVEDDPATEEDETAPTRVGVTDISAPDPYTVRVEFSAQPGLSVWQTGVGLAPIMPEHFWAVRVEEARASRDPAETLYGFSGEGQPSAGAMIFTDREPGVFAQTTMNMDNYYANTEYTFYADGSFRQKNDDRGFDEVYYGSGEGEITNQWTSGPYASEVVFSIYSTHEAAILALRNGEIDFLLSSTGLRPDFKNEVSQAPDLDLITNAPNGFRYLAFNMRKSPMSEQAFRRALGCVIDKEFMETLLQGAVMSSYSLVPPDNVFWANPEVEQLCKGLNTEDRFEEAVSILTAGGFTWDVAPEWDADNQKLLVGTGTGMKDPSGGTVPELELLVTTQGYDSIRSTYAMWIAQWASNLGIPVETNPTGLTALVDEILVPGRELTWDMYILGWNLGDPELPDFHESLFASYRDVALGGFNTPGYASDRVDELAAELLTATDFETARAAVQELDRIIVEEAPYVVLYRTPVLEAFRNDLQFPYTDTLAGLQGRSGLPADVRVAD